MARITKTFFDLFDDGDISEFESLLKDPSVVIERRSLTYIEPEEDYEDPDDNIPAKLLLRIRYSKYGTIVSTDNYYKKVRLFTTFGFGTNGEILLENFLESPNQIIDMVTSTEYGEVTYTFVEYTDRNYSLAGNTVDTGFSTKKLVRFDDYLEQYVPIEPNGEE